MLRTIMALLLLFIGSAAATAQPAPPKKADIRKSVGVISAIGHKFALQKVGITVFGNELKEVPIDSWGIDGAVVSKVSALLGKQFNVKKINYPKGAFTSYETPGGLFRDLDEELRTIVRQVAASQKCDLYVVVSRSYSPFSSTNQIVVGLGIVQAGSLLLTNTQLHAVSTIRVYEGQTFTVVQAQRASIGQPILMATINGPHRQVDESWWPASPQSAHNEKLKSATRELVEQSLATTIPEVMREVMGAKGGPRAKEAETWSPFKQ